MATEKKKVVVVGGGVAGALLAKSLQFDAHVILIDEKEYFEIPWASMRAMVEPSFAERSVINHTDYLTNVHLITSPATNITETEVFTAQGDHIAYDYLVIATGHTEYSPLATRTEKLNKYREEFEKINSASSILIIGGGPTGVELAGEIAVDFPNKKVILVHRGPRLLEFIGSKASIKALNCLTSKKVEVILRQSVDLNSVSSSSSSDGIYKTSSGESIEADCHFVCTGRPMGSAWLKETVLKNCLDIRGRLVVDEYLRVKGCKNVFAVGDITDIEEIKQGYLAQMHARLTAKNLMRLMAGGEERKTGTYKPRFSMASVSLGRKEAVMQLPCVTLCGSIPGMIKSRDLFVGKTRKQMGLKSGLA